MDHIWTPLEESAFPDQPKMTSRKLQAQKTKQLLYDTAISLFHTKGFEQTTIDDIVKKAGVSTGSFYVHFRTKNHVIFHCMSQYDEIASRSYWAASKEPTFAKQMRRYLQLCYILIEKMGKEVLKAYYRISLVGQEGASNGVKSTLTIHDKERPVFFYLRSIVDFGLSQGELSADYPPEFYVEQIAIAFMGLDYFWCSQQEDMDLLTLANQQATIIIAALTNLPPIQRDVLP